MPPACLCLSKACSLNYWIALCAISLNFGLWKWPISQLYFISVKTKELLPMALNTGTAYHLPPKLCHYTHTHSGLASWEILEVFSKPLVSNVLSTSSLPERANSWMFFVPRLWHVIANQFTETFVNCWLLSSDSNIRTDEAGDCTCHRSHWSRPHRMFVLKCEDDIFVFRVLQGDEFRRGKKLLHPPLILWDGLKSHERDTRITCITRDLRKCLSCSRERVVVGSRSRYHTL